MFMVMCLHSINAIGYPDMIADSGIEFYIVGLTKALCIVAVNVFVIISGYFGIQFSYKGLIKFLFQVLFFSLLCYTISIVFKLQSFSIKSLIEEGFSLGANTQWFVQSYIVLFLLSPILNFFTDNASKECIKVFIISFFLIQTILGFQFYTIDNEIRGGLQLSHLQAFTC